MAEQSRYLLNDDQVPTSWYNIVPDLPAPPPPPLHPATHQPIGPDDLAPLFPMDLILQEVSQDRYVPIPDEVRDVYLLWRATPLHRAHRLERALGTPARIYYKYEGTSPAGSHKPNTAVPQAYYNAKAGIRRLTTETGAGQWGTALSFAAAQYGIDCEIWQVRASYDQKPYRRAMMEAFGGTVHPSPSDVTEYGRKMLAEDPTNPGSLGIAITADLFRITHRVGTNHGHLPVGVSLDPAQLLFTFGAETCGFLVALRLHAFKNRITDLLRQVGAHDPHINYLNAIVLRHIVHAPLDVIHQFRPIIANDGFDRR